MATHEQNRYHTKPEQTEERERGGRLRHRPARERWTTRTKPTSSAGFGEVSSHPTNATPETLILVLIPQMQHVQPDMKTRAKEAGKTHPSDKFHLCRGIRCRPLSQSMEWSLSEKQEEAKKKNRSIR